MDLETRLPLTCTRLGTCCHGKQIWLNPWELACLAQARQEAPQAFRARDTVDGGIRLRCSGPRGWQGLPACSQYDPARGCSVHAARPLACRLYPLGRQRQGSSVTYLHEGNTFPCLAGCPGVRDLPQLTIKEYLAGQDVLAGESVQDAYLEMVEDLGEGAFVLLFDSGLAARDGGSTLAGWRQVTALSSALRAQRIAQPWLDRLTIPTLNIPTNHALDFVAAHRARVQQEAQAAFARLSEVARLSEASILLFALALHLAQSLGTDLTALGQRWIAQAEAHLG